MSKNHRCDCDRLSKRPTPPQWLAPLLAGMSALANWLRFLNDLISD